MTREVECEADDDAPSELHTRIRALEEKLEAQEQRDVDHDKQFVEQEHRFWVVVWNLLKHGRKRDDPLRTPVRKAMVWRMFAPSTLVIGGTGVVALLTFLEMRDQTSAIAEQNAHFAKQVEIEAEQDYRPRKAALIATLYDTRWETEEVAKVATVRQTTPPSYDRFSLAR